MQSIAYYDLFAGILIGISLLTLFTPSLREKLKIIDASKRKLGHINLAVSIMLMAFTLLPYILYARALSAYLIYFSIYMFVAWRISQQE